MEKKTEQETKEQFMHREFIEAMNRIYAKYSETLPMEMMNAMMTLCVYMNNDLIQGHEQAMKDMKK